MPPNQFTDQLSMVEALKTLPFGDKGLGQSVTLQKCLRLRLTTVGELKRPKFRISRPLPWLSLAASPAFTCTWRPASESSICMQTCAVCLSKCPPQSNNFTETKSLNR